MRWSDLFADLEAQLGAAEVAELRDEAAEHTRAATGAVRLSERFAADLGRRLRLRLQGGVTVEGVVVDVGEGWVLLRERTSAGDRDSLVVAHALLAVQGLSGRSDHGRAGRSRALGVRQVLRGLSRDRALVQLRDADGVVTTGTIDRVGADHLDVSAHPADLPRRSPAVHSVLTVPYAALVLVVPR